MYLIYTPAVRSAESVPPAAAASTTAGAAALAVANIYIYLYVYIYTYIHINIFTSCLYIKLYIYILCTRGPLGGDIAADRGGVDGGGGCRACDGGEYLFIYLYIHICILTYLQLIYISLYIYILFTCGSLGGDTTAVRGGVDGGCG